MFFFFIQLNCNSQVNIDISNNLNMSWQLKSKILRSTLVSILLILIILVFGWSVFCLLQAQWSHFNSMVALNELLSFLDWIWQSPKRSQMCIWEWALLLDQTNWNMWQTQFPATCLQRKLLTALWNTLLQWFILLFLYQYFGFHL